jgi:uncharacterized protein YlxW (UPF0749 family)
MSQQDKYKLKPPSVQAAPYDEVNDALQTIKTMISAVSTKIDSITQEAEFTLAARDGESPFVLKVAIGSVVVQGEGNPYVMAREEFNETFEKY